MLLPCAQIHVWRAPLHHSPRELQRYARLLSEDEAVRAGRFLFPRARNRFIAARGMLRELLAAYLDIPPRELRFSYNGHGKPGLQAPYFNLSHTADTVVYAMSRTAEVGVDIERMRRDFDWEAMSFALPDKERAELRGPDPHAAFLRGWVRREALCKAAGQGLSGMRPRGAREGNPGPRPEEVGVRRWSVHELSLGEDVVGAVATDGSGMAVRYFNWTERGALLRKGKPGENCCFERQSQGGCDRNDAVRGVPSEALPAT